MRKWLAWLLFGSPEAESYRRGRADALQEVEQAVSRKSAQDNKALHLEPPVSDTKPEGS